MLREWIRRLPSAQLLTICADIAARHSAVWRLATAELSRRRDPPHPLPERPGTVMDDRRPLARA
ncbi:MAG: hypothetical protein F8N37_02880 [Telmatospirillum sp.]|nr:hypothetical protein [Telmatospirillum sp.]